MSIRTSLRSGRRYLNKNCPRTTRRLFVETLEDRRLLTAGSLDTSFDGDGRVLTDIGTDGTSDLGFDAVAYQSDGKVLVAGYSQQNFTGNDFAVVRYNADGSLDSTFGDNGIATIDFGGSSDYARSISLDSQDNVLVAGYSYQGGTGRDFAVARLTSAGLLDSGFDSDGKQTIDFGSINDYGQGVAVDSQDNVLVAGYSYQGGTTGSDFAVARLTSAGLLDNGFDSDGKQTIDFGSINDYGQGVAVDSQDNVLVAGYSSQGGTTGNDFAVARLTSAGLLDSGFDSDGKQTIDFGSTSDIGVGVAVDSQDNVLVAGYSYQGGTTGSDFAVARLTSAGLLDSGFDSDGKQTIDFGSISDTGVGVAVDSQDNVLVAGYSYQGGTTGSDFAVARLTSAGLLDSGFDSDGKQTIDFGSTSDIGVGVAVDSQDNVLVAGRSYQGGTTGNDFAVARLTSAGLLDTSFDGDGRVLTDIGTDGTSDLGFDAVAYQSDGKVLVAGYSQQNFTGNDFAVVRYNADGSLDSTFGDNGIATIDFGGSSDYARGISLDSQDNVLVAGYSYQGGTTGWDFAVARLTSAGLLDSGFDSDGKQTIDFGSTSDIGYGVAVDSQDNVLVAGRSYQGGTTGNDFAVARLTSAGLLDSGFDSDGKQTIDFGSINDYGQGVAVDSQDNVLVAGRSYQGGTTGNDFAVARLTSAGLLDSGFDSDGKQTIDFGSISDFGVGVAVDSQDNVLVAGYSSQGGTTGKDFAVARLTSAGLLDSGFDSDGKQTIDFGSTSDFGVGVAVDSQDNVLVAGRSYQGGTGWDFAVARLTSAGLLDSGFDSDGKQTIDFGSISDIGYGVAVDSQDNVLVAGYSYQGGTTGNDFAVARLLGNRAPTADAGGPYSIDEGDSLTFDASASSDPDGDSLTYAWDIDNDGNYGDAVGVSPTLTWAELMSFAIDDDGTFTVGLQVDDGHGGTDTDTASLTVSNVAPAVGAITGPIDPVAVETSISVSASFTDPGTVDTHDAVWDWGDGQTTVVDPATSPVSGSHTYTAPGVYTVTLTVTDDDMESSQSWYEYVVVYDPSAGFVTGGGRIESPAGAYMADPTLTGTANFGFVAKYKKGAETPTGQTQFQFQVGNLNFHSTIYQWLVVSGARAQFKGEGTLSGSGEYGFLLTAIDGQVSGGGGTDKLRMKIWVKGDEENVIYDNRAGAELDADPDTALSSGSIVLHTGGKNQLANPSTTHVQGEELHLRARLDPIVERAIGHWADAGYSPLELQKLRQTEFHLANFSDNRLGMASNSTNIVWIDMDAAGHGWFVDAGAGVAPSSSFPAMDLLTVVTHELGHVLGKADLDPLHTHDVMAGVLDVGTQRLPTSVRGTLTDVVAADLFYFDTLLSQGHQQEEAASELQEITSELMLPPAVGTAKAVDWLFTVRDGSERLTARTLADANEAEEGGREDALVDEALLTQLAIAQLP